MSDVFISQDLLATASPGQKAEYESLLGAKRARRSPLDYMQHDSQKNKAYRHTKYLNEVAMALVEHRLYKSGPGPASVVIDITEEEPHGRRVHPVTGEPVLSKLMTSMPPRIGKSFFWGKYFPSWFLTTHTDATIMYMSYSASLSENFSRASRNTIAEHPELGVLIDPELASVKEWSLADSDGGFIARGFGGIPTGRGGNLIIDDPFKDGQEAMSDNRREFVWEQYISSLITRVERDCFTVVNGTRWHEDDLHGRLLQHEPDEWFEVNLAAVAFDDCDEDGVSIDIRTDDDGNVIKIRDPLGRRPGEAICPQLYPASYYRGKQKTDPFWYDAEYLGKPSGIGGGLFKDFAYYKRHYSNESATSIYEVFLDDNTSDFVAEDDCVRFATVDIALTEKTSSDWTVYAVWDLDPWRRLLLRHIERVRISGDKLDDWIRNQHNTWDVRVTGIEEASVSYKLIQDLIAAGGITIWPLPADKDKKVRSLPAAVLVKKKHLLVDRDATWRPKWEAEHKKFDKDKYDDQVDTTSYAAILRDLLAANPVPAKANKLPKGFEARMNRLADSVPSKEKSDGMVISNG